MCENIVEAVLSDFEEIFSMFKVAHGFETAVSIFDEFTDFSLYNFLYDKEYYIGI